MDDCNYSRVDTDIADSMDFEDVKLNLQEFNKSPTSKFSPLLENYLKSIARTGKTSLDWSEVRVFLAFKMDSVMRQSDSAFSMDSLGKFPNVENVSFTVLHQRILERFMTFNAAPFTVQRLCELLSAPKKHYKRSDKLLRGIEKNVMVVSCVDNDGNKLSHEPPPITDTQYVNMLCGATSRPAPVPSPTASSQHGAFKPPSPVAHSPRSEKQPINASCSSATPWSSPTTGQKTRAGGDEAEPPLKQARVDSTEDCPIDSGPKPMNTTGAGDSSDHQLTAGACESTENGVYGEAPTDQAPTDQARPSDVGSAESGLASTDSHAPEPSGASASAADDV